MQARKSSHSPRCARKRSGAIESNGVSAMSKFFNGRLCFTANFLAETTMSDHKIPSPERDNKSIAGDVSAAAISIPVAREEIELSKKTVETGTVRIRKIVREHEEAIEQPLLHEEVDVQRVSINRVIDAPVAMRYEGETLIVPVVEEVLLVQKQWVLKEELHISRHVVETISSQRVVLRSEEAIVEREPRSGG